jgi:phospholipase A1
MKTFVFIYFIFFFIYYSEANDFEIKNESLVGLNEKATFSIYKPNYFIFGVHDLKLQISVKYRLSKSLPLFVGLTQTMFWEIYKKSLPFKDINYSPELLLLRETNSYFIY